MFPSAKKNINKFCCDRSNCPKRNEIINSMLSSTIEKLNSKIESNQQHQMSSLQTSSSEKIYILDKISEKSSEAYFDRNNQNIKNCYNKFCPSNSSQISQTECQLHAITLKCPSNLFRKTPDARKCHCCQRPTPHCVLNKRHKCICKKVDITSSTTSSNLSTLHFPVKLNCRSEEKNIYYPPEIKHFPSLAKPQTNFGHLPASFLKNVEISSQEEFYSCSSEDSESEENLQKSNKNSLIMDASSKMSAPAPEIKLQLEDKTTSTHHATTLVWPPHACCCCICRMAAAPVPPFNFPFFQPYSLKVSATDDICSLQIPEPFLYDELTDSFKDCSSGNMSKSILTVDLTSCKLSENDSRSCLSGLVLKENTKSDAARGDKSSSCVNIEEYVDEELYPVYVDKVFTAPFDKHEPSPDSLFIYDDEEPHFSAEIEDIDEEIHPVVVQVKELDPHEMHQSCLDCLREYDDEEPIYAVIPLTISDTESRKTAENKSLEDLVKSDEVERNNVLDKNASNENDKSSEIEEVEVEVEVERTPYGRNIYNFLSDIAQPDYSTQVVTYNESGGEYGEKMQLLDDGGYELSKEILSESRKRKKPNYDDEDPSQDKCLATLKHFEGAGSAEEMKFFIDSLIMDLDAMNLARRKSQFQKNICKANVGLSNHDSFPVTITEVTKLGANSLYIKWKIHDCFGIGGYEIYTDGYLTNRYYSSRHDCAVITHVDVTLPHKVALVAQACANDESMDLICNMSREKNKPKYSPYKTHAAKEQSFYSGLWTPSIFLYDPITCITTAAAPSIMRDNFYEQQNF